MGFDPEVQMRREIINWSEARLAEMAHQLAPAESDFVHVTDFGNPVGGERVHQVGFMAQQQPTTGFQTCMTGIDCLSPIERCAPG